MRSPRTPPGRHTLDPSRFDGERAGPRFAANRVQPHGARSRRPLGRDLRHPRPTRGASGHRHTRAHLCLTGDRAHATRALPLATARARGRPDHQRSRTSAAGTAYRHERRYAGLRTARAARALRQHMPRGRHRRPPAIGRRRRRLRGGHPDSAAEAVSRRRAKRRPAGASCARTCVCPTKCLATSTR